MAGKGGARPGAGRKPKAIKFETQIQKAEGKIADKLPWIVDRLLELAEGVAVEKMTITGYPMVYQQPPDLGALKYLADRIMGKPTERSDVNLTTDEWIFDPTETNNAPQTNGSATSVLDK